MTPQQLIEEGRRLQRPCVFLRPKGSGPVAAVWYDRDDDEFEATGRHCWLSVDARQIPDLSPQVSGFLSVFTDDVKCEGGRVEVTASWPDREGTELYAHVEQVLPPVNAVFARGSRAVGDWLRSHRWSRTFPYNENFGGADVVKEYDRIWMKEFPIFAKSDVYAVLGGWHWPSPDDDWHDLIDEQLLVLTLRDCEPWVEAWRTKAGKYQVIQRIT